jgi:hypothetical protein
MVSEAAMRARIIVFFLIATLFSWTTAFSIAVPPHPDELHAKLISRVDNYELDAGSFVEALDRVAKEFQIPMGIEWIMTPAAETRVSMSWKDVSVLEIIESIIKTQTGYAVSFTNGAVQVSCSSLIRQSQNPGFVKINTFNVERTSLGWTSKLLRITLIPRDTPARLPRQLQRVPKARIQARSITPATAGSVCTMRWTN